jgi:hypothetical protein
MQNVPKNLFLNSPAALAERGQAFLRLAYLPMNQRKIVQARSVLLLSEHCSADFERGFPDCRESSYFFARARQRCLRQ